MKKYAVSILSLLAYCGLSLLLCCCSTSNFPPPKFTTNYSEEYLHKEVQSFALLMIKQGREVMSTHKIDNVKGTVYPSHRAFSGPYIYYDKDLKFKYGERPQSVILDEGFANEFKKLLRAESVISFDIDTTNASDSEDNQKKLERNHVFFHPSCEAVCHVQVVVRYNQKEMIHATIYEYMVSLNDIPKAAMIHPYGTSQISPKQFKTWKGYKNFPVSYKDLIDYRRPISNKERSALNQKLLKYVENHRISGLKLTNKLNAKHQEKLDYIADLDRKIHQKYNGNSEVDFAKGIQDSINKNFQVPSVSSAAANAPSQATPYAQSQRQTQNKENLAKLKKASEWRNAKKSNTNKPTQKSELIRINGSALYTQSTYFNKVKKGQWSPWNTLTVNDRRVEIQARAKWNGEFTEVDWRVKNNTNSKKVISIQDKKVLGSAGVVKWTPSDEESLGRISPGSWFNVVPDIRKGKVDVFGYKVEVILK